MREIKFRAWNKSGKMIQPFHFVASGFTDADWIVWGSTHEEFRKNIENPFPPQQFEIMQFTGHQINKTDLYESDIIREEYAKETGDERNYFVVTWINEWSMFAFLEISEYKKYLEYGAEELDESMFWTFPVLESEFGSRAICGNIYENPELLNSPQLKATK